MSSALLVIDVQAGLFNPVPRPALADEVLARINALISCAHMNRAAVIFVQHESAAGELQYGSEGWALASELSIGKTDHTVRKTTPDSFLRTELSELLAALDVSRLVVCGYATEFCVDTTVRRAAALGHDVILAADAHTTHDKAHASAAQIRMHHNATLPSISSFGPKICAVASAEIDFSAL